MTTTVSICTILSIFIIFIVIFSLNLFQFIFLGISLNYGLTSPKFRSQSAAVCDFTLDDAFSDDFIFGASSSAYQVEGAWQERGLTIWDTAVHQDADIVKDRSNGDIACDSYHKFMEDIKALKEVGFKSYHFSISWARVLPLGTISSLNQAGIDYYHNIIDALLENGIEPVITMHHYDTPQAIQDLGGPLNSLFMDYFEEYANFLFKAFGDKVSKWITFNQPYELCVLGYSTGALPPRIHGHGVAEYFCGHNILMSHARVYHLYDRVYRSRQNGRIGLSLSSRFYYPKEGENFKDVDRAIQYWLGWFAHPIFSTKGGYPSVMVTEIAQKSFMEGRSHSRLPEMSEIDKSFIKGTADFFGLNYYTSNIISRANDTTTLNEGKEKDLGLTLEYDQSWTASQTWWLYSVPQGLEDILKWIQKEYGDPEIWILENGWSDKGEIEDFKRIEYIRHHLQKVLKAKKCDGVKVKSYNVWSLLDNFEWAKGYTEKFGLYSVNFTSDERERTPKLSSKFMAEVIKERNIPESCTTT